MNLPTACCGAARRFLQHSRPCLISLDFRLLNVMLNGNAGAGVDMAIMDTGMDYTHTDLDLNHKDGYDSTS